MIERGPNQDDIQDLYRAGVLAPYAVLVWPDMGLKNISLPPAAQQELFEYLMVHPEVLANPPCGLAAVIAYLPTGIRTDIYLEQRDGAATSRGAAVRRGSRRLLREVDP